MTLSRQFPHRDLIRAAARATVLVEQARSRGAPVDPTMLRGLQMVESKYATLPANEQEMVRVTFFRDKEQVALEQHRAIEAQQEQQFANHVDHLSKTLTTGIGRPQGMPMYMAAALRGDGRVKVRVNKQAHGPEADRILQANFGLSKAQLFEKMDTLVADRPKLLYGARDKQAWRDHLEAAFPGVRHDHADEAVRSWPHYSLELELRERAEAKKPDTRTLKMSDEDERRLDLVTAVANVESEDPNSLFLQEDGDRLVGIIEESQSSGHGDDLRASIAGAMLHHGSGFDVSGNPGHDDTTDEVLED